MEHNIEFTLEVDEKMYRYLSADQAKEIGPRIKSLLKKKGVTVTEAADAFSIGRSNYYKFLQGTRNMPIELLVAHCVFFNVSLSFLIFGEDIPEWDDKDYFHPGEIDYKTMDLVEQIQKLEHPRKKKQICKLMKHLADLVGDME